VELVAEDFDQSFPLDSPLPIGLIMFVYAPPDGHHGVRAFPGHTCVGAARRRRTRWRFLCGRSGAAADTLAVSVVDTVAASAAMVVTVAVMPASVAAM